MRPSEEKGVGICLQAVSSHQQDWGPGYVKATTSSVECTAAGDPSSTAFEPTTTAPTTVRISRFLPEFQKLETTSHHQDCDNLVTLRPLSGLLKTGLRPLPTVQLLFHEKIYSEFKSINKN